MSSRKIGATLIGLATLGVIIFTIYKLAAGKEIGFNEIGSISILLMMYFSAITWGTKEEKDGILQEEELGQRITEKSAKISYFILLVAILLAVATEQWIYGSSNIFLLIILALAMCTLPFVEFLVARKYQ
ncbi:hypothetical protein MKY41_16240 [Sporosarcina sp. FSL W7-1349]|uniref:hypothetical protein n=1 Tax=Sporosarcina sp. FSL W7-1349 TaxID=2921561 RepID=UPI0030F9ACBE